MKEKKNILFIISRLPIDLLSGDRIRNYHFINELNKRGWRVDVIGFVPAEPFTVKTNIKDITNTCIEIDRQNWNFNNNRRLKQLKGFIKSLFTAYPFRVWQWNDERLINQAKKMIAKNDYGVIHFSDLAMGKVFMELQKKPNKAKFIFDLCDSISMQLFNSLKQNSFSLFTPFRFIEYFRMKRYEKKVINCSNRSIYISPRDKAFIGSGKPAVIPNGIAPVVDKKVNEDIDLLFTGGMNYEPNIDACLWFAEKVLPDLVGHFKDLKFYIVGQNPPAVIKALAGKNIKVTGFVDDINLHYQRAKLFICPMRLGAGQKNKILEAMINKTAVVSTSEGNLGIHAPPSAILTADSKLDFKKTIINLLENEKKRRQLARAGFNFVKDNFTWSKSVDLLEKSYQSEEN